MAVCFGGVHTQGRVQTWVVSLRHCVGSVLHGLRAFRRSSSVDAVFALGEHLGKERGIPLVRNYQFPPCVPCSHPLQCGVQAGGCALASTCGVGFPQQPF